MWLTHLLGFSSSFPNVSLYFLFLHTFLLFISPVFHEFFWFIRHMESYASAQKSPQFT